MRGPAQLLPVAQTDSNAPPAASTKRAKAKGKAAEVDSGDEGDEDERPRKKARGPRKGQQSKQKKGQGKLEVFKTLAVEMVTEVRLLSPLLLVRRLRS